MPQTYDKRKVYSKVIPYSKEDFFQQYKNLSINEPYHALLESGRHGRYSIVGLQPHSILKGKNNQLIINQDDSEIIQSGDPLVLMQEWMEAYDVEYQPNLPDFQGGAIGFFSYDCLRYIEKIPHIAEDDLETPDLYFLVFSEVAVYDHHTNELWLMVIEKADCETLALARLEKYKETWTTFEKAELTHPQGYVTSEPDYSFSEEEFVKAVEQIQEYISAGDVFQVNLSVRQSQPLKTHPYHIYEKLREINPSPYMSYIHVPDFQIISGSPELLVKKRGTEVSTRPIAGTRSRGKDFEEDEQLARQLIENEKERAEHVMLVDLERNDLGRVCKYGTVEVNEFMVIERYSHVMHIVSNVRGTLNDETDPYAVVRATFPGGTITGAPKVRTMEIIEELEPVRRGIYTGSIGWIGYNHDMELNIVIRTMLAKDGIAHVQAGAGIVIDSNPKAEYKESFKKAKALWRAKEVSEEECLKKVQNIK